MRTLIFILFLFPVFLQGQVFTSYSAVSGVECPVVGNRCNGVKAVSYGGETYATVAIGTQCWLQRNLNIGAKVSGATNQTNNGTIEKYCYDDDDANCVIYGGMYQWDEAMQYVTTESAQGICPSGWHIPTVTEFNTLVNCLGGMDVAGGKLKEIGTTHWTTPNTGATNSSGFTGLPGGWRSSAPAFANINNFGFFFTSTEVDATYVKYFWFSYNGQNTSTENYFKSAGFSIRCLKN